MGMFTKGQKAASARIYDKEVKQYICEKDGHTHILMVNSFSKWLNQNFGVEDKYTTQINEILSSMQEDGYEIVDIKLGTLQDQGISKQMEGFNTLIIYK